MTRKVTTTPRTVRLPEPIREIYAAVAKLEAAYPGRRFTPDGHLVGSIGEVVVADALGLELLPSSSPVHDARAPDGSLVQIKATAGKGISLYANCERLVVLTIDSASVGTIIYDGPGALAWDAAGKVQKNGQRRLSLSKLRRLAEETKTPAPLP